MVQSSAATVAEYVASLPPERRQAIMQVRTLIRRHLPSGYQERMSFGMIGYELPLERFRDTYNGKPLVYVAIAEEIASTPPAEFIRRYQASRR